MNENAVEQKLRKISEKINSLAFKVSSHDSKNKRSDEKPSHNSNGFRHKQNFSCQRHSRHFPPQKFHKKNLITCQLCNKHGHTDQSCFK